MKRIWTLALVSLVLLGGCRLQPSSPSLPTVGPVIERSGAKGIIDTELTTSTNCVNVGETLVIRGIVKNEASYPLRFEDTPAFDFIIRPWIWDPTAGPEPVRRWSETADYPAIDPVLAPGETRTYEWRWPVEPVYATPSRSGIRALRIQFWQGDIKSEGFPAGGQTAGVGVGGLPAPESASSLIPCQELRNR